MKVPDQSAFAGPRPTYRAIFTPISIYVSTKLLPLICYFVLITAGVESSLLGIIIVLTLLLEFFVMKNISGLQLLGLKWFLDIHTHSIAIFSRPEPFIPAIGDSNFFWVCGFFSVAFWFVCFLIEFFQSRLGRSGIAFIAAALNSLNLACFIQAHRISKSQLEAAVLNSMRDGVSFDLVPEQELEAREKDPVIPAAPDRPSTAVDLPPPLASPDQEDDDII
jgi:hypothetical protein